jgi:hypothetical protein
VIQAARERQLRARQLVRERIGVLDGRNVIVAVVK